jgi:TonB-dependent SusC/RagA subfamily outer membrane receptor
MRMRNGRGVIVTTVMLMHMSVRASGQGNEYRLHSRERPPIVQRDTIAHADTIPLYVVNGVNMNRRFGRDSVLSRVQAIPPWTIQSITVLKGPRATTLFGAEGQRGVVIITTSDVVPPK